MDRLNVEELEALYARTTQGNYTHLNAGKAGWAVRVASRDDRGRQHVSFPFVCNTTVQPNEANAEFAARIHNDLPILTAYIRELEATLARLQAVWQGWRDEVPTVANSGDTATFAYRSALYEARSELEDALKGTITS